MVEWQPLLFGKWVVENNYIQIPINEATAIQLLPPAAIWKVDVVVTTFCLDANPVVAPIQQRNFIGKLQIKNNCCKIIIAFLTGISFLVTEQ